MAAPGRSAALSADTAGSERSQSAPLMLGQQAAHLGVLLKQRCDVLRAQLDRTLGHAQSVRPRSARRKLSETSCNGRMLSAARLRLRAPSQRDIPAIVEGCSDRDVARYIPIIWCFGCRWAVWLWGCREDGAAVGNEDVRCLSGHGFGEVEALAGVGAERGQGLVLFGGFHPFGGDGHAEAVRELND